VREEQEWSEAAIAALPAWTLVQAYHVIARRFWSAFADAGLGPTQFGVLATLAATPGLGQGELARRNLVSPQSIGELISSLEERGLVERPAKPGRGRRRTVHLTQAGHQALQRIAPAIRTINAPASLGLSATEAVELNRLLHAIRATA
jgi:DNA-binding MarR family transcriptional regulator